MAESLDAMRDELEELRTRVGVQEAELEFLRPLAVRHRITEAGFDPDGPAGRVLAELAGHDKTLAASSARMATKAASLGFAADRSASPSATPSNPNEPALTDPRYGADHPRNQPGTQANRLARIEAEKANKASSVLAQMNQADSDGHPGGQVADPLADHLASRERQPGPAPTAKPGPPRYDEAQRREYEKKSQTAAAQLLGEA